MLCSGKEVWQGAKSERNDEQLPKVAAQLQGLHMGLLAAQQLGFHSVVVQAPNSRPLLQASLLPAAVYERNPDKSQ